MVPGAFRAKTPDLAAKPLLDLTWHSYPLGNAIAIPVGTITIPPAGMISCSSIAACKSIPAEPVVA